MFKMKIIRSSFFNEVDNLLKTDCQTRYFPKMFQFTDDDDPDVEGLLDLPLDNLTGKYELNSTKCSESDNLKDILNDCDENEMILSMIDNVDCSTKDQSLTKESSNNCGFKILDTVSAACGFPLRNNCQNSTEKYITINNVKHKLTSAEPCTSKAPRVEYERKFPGPAGLIPKKSTCTTPVKYQVLPDGSPKQADVPPVKNDFLFENGCWDQLINDCETISPRLSAIIEENSVASVRRMNIVRSKPRKLQFFGALIVNIDCSVCDPSVVLKDSTGEIHGTLHKELWETYGNLLTVGTAVLLKQVSVLSITNSRKLYVNVTSNNLVKLYTPRSGAPILVTRVVELSPQDFTSHIKKNERLVFEETQPNVSIAVKEVPTRKASIPSVSKTDNLKSIRNENVPKKVELVHSVEPIKSQTRKEVFFDDLEGIDADSLFGEF